MADDMKRKGAENRTEGKVDEMKGRARSAAGDISGDRSQQLKGQGEQLKGKAKQALGDAQDSVSDENRSSNR